MNKIIAASAILQITASVEILLAIFVDVGDGLQV